MKQKQINRQVRSLSILIVSFVAGLFYVVCADGEVESDHIFISFLFGLAFCYAVDLYYGFKEGNLSLADRQENPIKFWTFVTIKSLAIVFYTVIAFVWIMIPIIPF